MVERSLAEWIWRLLLALRCLCCGGLHGGKVMPSNRRDLNTGGAATEVKG